MDANGHMPARREPMFNLPRAVSMTLGVLILVHLVRVVLPPEEDFRFLISFAFVPIRYAENVGGLLPGGEAAAIWSFFTYALLHGDVVHLLVNSVWMAAFGSALAWRFGTARFLIFSAACAAGGAMAHLFSHWGEMMPMVGASAAVSGHMAAVARYAFQGGIAGALGRGDRRVFLQPAQPLGDVLRDPRVFAFLAVWFGLNIAFGTGIVSLDAEGAPIAWEAHIGGFLVGLVLFRLFDPVPPVPPAPEQPFDEPRTHHVGPWEVPPPREEPPRPGS